MFPFGMFSPEQGLRSNVYHGIETWVSISPTRGATPKHGSRYTPLEGPHPSAGVRTPNLRGHTKARESVSPLCGRHQSVGVRIPNLSGHVKAWESVSPTQGATLKCWSPCPQLEGPHEA